MRTAVAIVIVSLGTPDMGLAALRDDVNKEVRRVIAGTVEVYKWFHQHPELSNQEVETAKRLGSELEKSGVTIQHGVGGTGIIGVLANRKNPKGPVVLYRADMDGLPVTEATGVPYASKNIGVMHACGHDVHMAVAVGTLRVLRALEDHWRGTVLFIGQPAEEIGTGARAMLNDAKLKSVIRRLGKPKLAIALHDAADLTAGRVSLLGGYANANVDSVDIIVHGRGGHGAWPHDTIDPIVIGSEIVMTLQTIVSRRLRPGEKAVVTVGKFDAGTKHNIIPSKAKLLLTVRSYTDAVRKKLLDEIKHIAVSIARAHHAPRDPQVIVLDEFTPAAYNDPDWTERLRKVYASTLGKDEVETHSPSLGGEDFGRFARQLKIPGVMYKLGAVDPKKAGRNNLPGLHSDRWAAMPKPTLQTGIFTMTLGILEGLR